jgi:hypothetical protein
VKPFPEAHNDKKKILTLTRKFKPLILPYHFINIETESWEKVAGPGSSVMLIEPVCPESRPSWPLSSAQQVCADQQNSLLASEEPRAVVTGVSGGGVKGVGGSRVVGRKGTALCGEECQPV